MSVQIKDETERLKFYSLLKEKVIPQLFEGYFSKIFEFRDHEDNWNERAALTDLFVPFQEKKTGKKFLQCLVPGVRVHWDIILAAYHVFCPKVFPDTQKVALSIWNLLRDYPDLNPKDIKNYGEVNEFGDSIHQFLVKYSMGIELKGGNYNQFLTDPAGAVFTVKRLECLMTRGYEGDETDDEISEDLWVTHVEDSGPVSRPCLELLSELMDRTKKEIDLYLS